MARRQPPRTGPACRWALSALLCGSAGGCFFMPKEAGVRMQTELLALRGEVQKLQQTQEAEHAAKREHDQASDAQLASIQKRLAETSQTSNLATADMGTQLERLVEDVQRLRGAIEVNEHRMDGVDAAVEQKLSERLETQKKAGEQRERERAARAARAALPSGKKEQLAYGRKLLRDRRTEEGREVLRELSKLYSKERGVGDEALLTLAADALAANKPDVALRDYVQLLDLFANGPHSDEAYFRVAQCSQLTGRTEDARTFYNEVVTGYPKSKWARQAKQKLQGLEATPAK